MCAGSAMRGRKRRYAQVQAWSCMCGAPHDRRRRSPGHRDERPASFHILNVPQLHSSDKTNPVLRPAG